MGWYHVNNTGKGITLGDGEEVHYNEDYLAKYAPTKEEVLDLVPSFKNEDLKGYESWPLYMKFVAAAGDWYNLRRAKDYGSDCLKEDAHIIYANALCRVFEKCYGYPAGSFYSTFDYDGNTMVFCAIDWPPKEYNEKLATLTEKKLEAELQEFLVNVTGDESYAERKLEFCEEYIKE